MSLMITSIGFSVLGGAENGTQTVEMHRGLRPDVLLLDINMPNMSGVEVLDEIMKSDPSAIIIMLTSINSFDVVRQCLDGGAKHYILKDNSVDNMRDMLQEAITMNMELITKRPGRLS